MTPCRDTMPTIRSAPIGRSSLRLPRSIAASKACGSRLPAAISARAPRRKPARRWSALPRRSTPHREIEIPEAERARSAAYVITATEGAAFASGPAAQPRQGFRSRGPRPADRRPAGPGAARHAGAEIPPLVSAQVLELFNDVDRHPVHRRRQPPRPSSDRRRSCSTASRWRCAPTSASTPSRFPSSACRWWPRRCRSAPLPIAVQIIAAPWREDVALRVAYALEQAAAKRAPHQGEPYHDGARSLRGLCGGTLACAR